MASAALMPILLIVLVGFMVFSFRKQKKQVNEQTAMQESLQPGTRVMTSSGMYGTIVGLGEDTIDLEIAPGLVTTWVRRAVLKVIEPETTDAPSIESIDEEDDAAPRVDLDKDDRDGDDR
ncbi:preprotein translocase subunit YajC [Tsukamurella sp. 8F]|uniref:preprotein translocase subunit YajC n=1 Tax=unclassified Tsukamurella TaxID=2633480 RepID=UPI0023B99D87|nr:MULTISPECIES: preprotein translocase subunit YajC [unclassified Tsukamurella]MDF0529149.1 preprotein translocase subunit YajC [Tsukamurella sp. 8J]MDF0585334.1 preprotein translocase subunit YajC [Tsukamurella sp. 8F]